MIEGSQKMSTRLPWFLLLIVSGAWFVSANWHAEPLIERVVTTDSRSEISRLVENSPDISTSEKLEFSSGLDGAAPYGKTVKQIVEDGKFIISDAKRRIAEKSLSENELKHDIEISPSSISIEKHPTTYAGLEPIDVVGDDIDKLVFIVTSKSKKQIRSFNAHVTLSNGGADEIFDDNISSAQILNPNGSLFYCC